MGDVPLYPNLELKFFNGLSGPTLLKGWVNGKGGVCLK